MRTADDTWDLTTGVGTTATGVAAFRALASKSPEPLIDDPYAESLVSAVGVEQFIRLIDGDAGDYIADIGVAADAMAIRTQFFDNFLLDAAAAGVRQAVILASGLDTRGYRLDWPDGMVVFELDRPEVLDFKVRALAEMGAVPAADIRNIGIDLRRDWPTALRSSGFDATQPTAWIAEGLLGYLPPEDQELLFDLITTYSLPESRLATDWRPTAAEISVEMGELLYSGDRIAADTYLDLSGWRVHTETAAQRFVANGMSFRREDAIAGLCDAQFTVAVR